MPVANPPRRSASPARAELAPLARAAPPGNPIPCQRASHPNEGPSQTQAPHLVSANFDVHNSAALRCTSRPLPPRVATALCDAQERRLLGRIKTSEVVHAKPAALRTLTLAHTHTHTAGHCSGAVRDDHLRRPLQGALTPLTTASATASSPRPPRMTPPVIGRGAVAPSPCVVRRTRGARHAHRCHPARTADAHPSCRATPASQPPRLCHLRPSSAAQRGATPLRPARPLFMTKDTPCCTHVPHLVYW